MRDAVSNLLFDGSRFGVLVLVDVIESDWQANKRITEVVRILTAIEDKCPHSLPARRPIQILERQIGVGLQQSPLTVLQQVEMPAAQSKKVAKVVRPMIRSWGHDVDYVHLPTAAGCDKVLLQTWQRFP